MGTPNEETDEWSSKWFYVDDVPLFEPVQRGLPKYSVAPLKKRFCWLPKSKSEEYNSEVRRLAAKVKMLAYGGLTIVQVMVIVITRCVQLLLQRIHPLWDYCGTDDSTRSKRQGPDTHADLAAILADFFKG
ncbi:hypothetical protein D1007_06724 [Hordeum vulgare]|nr:hypothetical protein D1007_06724 [Hordeum vulgare]